MKALLVGFATLLWMITVPATLIAQPGTAPIDTPSLTTSALPLNAAQQRELETSLRQRAFKQAETLLVNEINKNPTAPATAKLLVAVAGIFFLDGDYLNTAIAYKKAEKIAPLDEPSRFTLAMAYLKLNRADWAKQELIGLNQAAPNNALYLYWLGRIEYDTQKYPEAIAYLKKAIALDPLMMRAYDNLGLCYEHVSDNESAIRSYRRAIELNRVQANPSPWPLVNLTIMLVGRNELAEAEKLVREALRYDPLLPQAHYNLGVIQEKQNQLAAAIESLQTAIELDANYAEPHYILSRIHQKQGEKEKARTALESFQRLKRSK